MYLKKDWPIYNIKSQTDEKSTDKTTQLNLYKMKLKLFIEYNQNYYIDISRSIS